MKSSNPVLVSSVNAFVEEVNTMIEDYYSTRLTSLTPKKLSVSEGSKFVKLICDNSVWGFISKYDGMFQGTPVKVGDLMKAAGWRTPAKHARGNIMNGTAKYDWTGPLYLK